ncbi:MAG TPA: hypothetical protein VM186_02835 [Planctomycetota bacterium]|nr:hypothetical protein [Planctomycetota bacterium]
MLQITWPVILIASAIAAALMCASIARDKNRNVAAWFLIGLICNLPAVAVLVRMKKLDDKR